MADKGQGQNSTGFLIPILDLSGQKPWIQLSSHLVPQSLLPKTTILLMP